MEQSIRASCAHLCATLSFAFGLGLAACGGGGGGGGGTTGPGAQFPLTALAPLAPPQVDAPGRVSLFVRALGPEEQGLVGLTASAFNARENGQALPANQIALRDIHGAHASATYVVVDWTDSALATQTLSTQILDALKVCVQELFEHDSAHVAIGLLHADGLVFLGPPGAPFSGFSDDLAEVLAACAAPPSVTPSGDSSNLFGALTTAALALHDCAALLKQQAGFQEVDENLVLFAEGPDTLGLTTAIAAELAIAELETRCIAFGPATLAVQLEPLGFDGFEQTSESDDLPTLFAAAGLSLAQRSRAVVRLGVLSNLVDGQPIAALAIEATAGGGAASVETSFDPSGFSAGAGLLDARRLDFGALEGRVEAHRAVAPALDGRLYVLSEYADEGFVVTRLDASGALDPTFGDSGTIVVAADGVGAPTVTPIDLVLDATGTQVFVCAEHVDGSGVTQAKVYKLDANGVSDSELLPRSTTTWHDYPRQIVRDASGRLYVGVSAGVSPILSRRVVVFRLNQSLALDASFGTGGTLIWGPGTASAKHSNKALVVSGGNGNARLFVAGESALNATAQLDLRVVAFTESGSVDTTFGTGGSVYNAGTFHHAPFGAFGSASSAALDSSGRIVVAGGIQSLIGTQLVPCVWRVTPQGAPDATFVGNASNPYGPGNPYDAQGLVTLPAALTGDPDVLFGKDAFIEDVGVGPTGALVTLGWRVGFEQHLDAFWLRLRADGVLDTEFNGVGFLLDDGALANDWTEFPRALAVGAAGHLISAGFSNDAPLGIGGVDFPLLFIDTDPSRAF